MIKIKKLLTSLAAIGITTSSASLVVSCGPSFNSLRTRTIDNSVYKTTFNHSIQNWNMAATMQSADYKILANLQDSLMSFDNNSDREKLTGRIADVVKQDSKSITLKVNDNAQWFNITNGNAVRKITADDIANTAKYTLDPANASEEIGDWKVLVKGAADVSNKLGEAEKDFSDGKINQEALTNKKKEIFAEFISYEDLSKPIYVNKDKNEITIQYANMNNYFETVLAGGSFAPTPIEAFNMGYGYGRDDYRDVLITGPYYMAEYKPSYIMKFKRNPNYKLVDKGEGTIDTIEYLYSLNSDDASQRRLWEDGDITEAKVTPSDPYGMKQYKDFDGVENVTNNLVGLKYIDFNFAKHPDIDKDPTQEDKNSNYALSLSSVRTLIAYAMNRQILIKYFSGKDDVNKYITNSYNPAGYLEHDGKDYVKDYLTGVDDGMGELVARDAYYKNLALLRTESVNSLDELITKINNQLKDHVSAKPVLSFLTSGANKNTFNPYIKKMIEDFNNIKNNPIKIVEQPTADDAAYQVTQTKGDFSMFITGASPSYLDPMSFLIDLKINGKMSAYNGLSRLYGKDNDAFSKYNVSDEFKDSMKKINTSIEDADKESETDKRFDAFAKAESQILYQYKNVIPLYKPDGDSINYLTYVDKESRPNIGYGYNDFRLNKVKLYKTIKDLINNRKEEQPKAILNKEE